MLNYDTKPNKSVKEKGKEKKRRRDHLSKATKIHPLIVSQRVISNLPLKIDTEQFEDYPSKNNI